MLKQHEGIPVVHGTPPQMEETKVAKEEGRCSARRTEIPYMQFSPVLLRNLIPVMTTITVVVLTRER